MLSNDSRRLTYTLKTNPPYRHLLCLQHKVNADALREPTQEPNCGLCIHNNISRVSDIIKSQCHLPKYHCSYIFYFVAESATLQ